MCFALLLEILIFGCCAKSVIGILCMACIQNNVQYTLQQTKQVGVQYNYAGMVKLSPEMVAPVCHVGDPLLLTCTASVEFIR